jgi:UDP-galactopyranose mutase
MKKALIIGGGFAGCAAAHQLVLKGGWDVTLIESAPFLGAGVRTSWYGGHPYTFGPRHFLTQNEDVYRYLNEIIPLRSCSEHEFITYVERDNAFYNYPIHVDDISNMPDRDVIEREREEIKGVENATNLEEYWLGSVGRTLYEKFIDKYNKKMWLVDDNRKIDTFNWSPKGVALKEGPRAAWDTAMSAYPYAANGYNDYFDISTVGVTVLLSTQIEHYEIPEKTVVIDGDKAKFDLIVNTISPDILFEQCFGELPFIGRDIHLIVFPTESIFPENVFFLYYANDEKFTRLVEYKKFTHHKSPTTLIGMEIPSQNGKHYPVPFRSEINRARKYFDLMPEGVYSIGRAGSYAYGLDIDDCIEQALELSSQLKQGGQDHPVAKCSMVDYRQDDNA